MNWENVFPDRHAGETAIVIGNGPSLRNVPLDFLKRYASFGTNRIYLLPDFTATYYCSVNPLVIEQSAAEINAYGAQAKFIADSEAHRIPGCYQLISTGNRTFSYNPAAYIFEGHTVTYVCLQLAFHMGFDTVLLVGVDHKFKMDGPPNSETEWQGDDPNHFSPDYFRGTRWNNPDLRNSEIAYKLARKAFEDAGRRIINLTDGSALDVFERGTVAEWLK
jgi:hypothetical protein